MSLLNEIGLIPTGGTSQKLVTRLISKRFTHEDFTAAATSDTEAFESWPSGPVWFLEGWVDLDQAFAGAGPVTAATIDLGDAGDPDELIDGVDVFATLGAKSVRGARAYGYFEAGHTPIVTLTLTGGNCSALTAGEVTVYQRIAYIEER
jgi:hypothetical protein